MLSSLFNRTKSAFWQIYPDLAPLREAVVKHDWAAISKFFGDYPAEFDASAAVEMVGNLAGAEAFLQRMVDERRDDPLPRLLLAARFIEIGWKARSRLSANHVTRTQFEVFFDYLRRAERLLSEVTADQPLNAAAWTLRLDTARGLQFGVNEARRRYEQAAQSSPHPYMAQRRLLQQLCPKWNRGPFGPALEFAQECLREAPPGALSGAVVAEAHLEYAWAHEQDLAWIDQYLGRLEIVQVLQDAAQRSVLHPDYRPVHGWVTAHGVFAYVYWMSADHRAARPHLEAMGTSMTGYPWAVSHRKQGHAGFRRARSMVL